jgi:hypothetical protein
MANAALSKSDSTDTPANDFLLQPEGIFQFLSVFRMQQDPPLFCGFAGSRCCVG